MPAVFVHGNPETIAIWNELVPRLSRTDIVRLSPPGFGAPVPAGFTAKADEYREWLARELQTIGEPIDLVGHDWGGLHVIRIAMERPELVRSWASDAAGGFDPDYVWHGLAQVWQTPDAGEQAIAQRLSMDVDARAQTIDVARGEQEYRGKDSARIRRDDGTLRFGVVPLCCSTSIGQLGQKLARCVAQAWIGHRCREGPLYRW